MVASSPETAQELLAERASLSEVIEHEQVKRKRRMVVRSVAATGVLAAAVALAFTFRPRPPPLVDRFQAAAVEHGEVVRHVAATGRVQPRSSVEIGAQVSGRIEEVTVDFNDEVTQGQVLARLDTEGLQAQAAQARASLRAAKASVKRSELERATAARHLIRTQRLHARGIEPQESLEAAQTQLSLAEAAKESTRAQLALQKANASLAETNLQYAVVRSPISGVVISRHVDPGQTVVAALQTPVLFVVAEDLGQMRVVVNVDEADIGEVKPGQSATFTVDAYPDRRFDATVAELRMAATVVQSVVTYEALLEVDNPERSLRPGMTASVKIETARVEGTAHVPNAALRFTPPGREPLADHHAVWVIRDAALVPIHVTPGVTDGKTTAISGATQLEPGERVLVDLSAQGRKLVEDDRD